MKLSVAIITFNEEANLERTFASVRSLVANGEGEIIVVDSGSTDRTVEIARKHGARVFVEEWKGYAAQKNSALEKCSGEWILSLDADEEVSAELKESIRRYLTIAEKHREYSEKLNVVPENESDAIYDEAFDIGPEDPVDAFYLRRRNYFLGRWIRHGGFYPDKKLRLMRRGLARFEDRPVHESVKFAGAAGEFHSGDLLHHAYPTLSEYIEHMNKYSSLGAEMVAARGRTQGNFLVWKWNIVIRPAATFLYNYVVRLGFLDGREGLLLHMYHAVYVSWKYAKAWEMSRGSRQK